MFRIILVSIITCIVAFLNAQYITNPFLRDTKVNASILTCFLNIMSSAKLESVLVIYSNENEADIFINQIHYVNPVTSSIVMVNIKKKFEEVKNNGWRYKMIVIIAEDVQVIQNVFKKLYLTPIWEPRSKYLVVYHREQYIENIFHLAYSRYILNVNVLRNNDTNIYTYFPYGNGSCGEDIQPAILGNCYNIPWQDLFPVKVPKVLNGCKVRIITGYEPPAVLDANTTSDDPKNMGFELTIVNNIMKEMNLTKDMNMINITGYPYKLSNGSYSYSSLLYYLYEDMHDLACGAMFFNESFIYDFDTTRIFRLDILKWHVPTAELGAQWKNIILIFQKTLWYTVFGMLILNAIIWWLFSKAANETSSFGKCVFGVLILLLNGAVQFPRTSVMRYLVVSWTLFALLLIATYQSQLLSILMKPVYEKQITTMEDIVESNLNVIMLKQQFLGMSSSGIPVQMLLAKKAKTVDFVTYITRVVNYTKDTAFIGREIKSRYLMPSTYIDKNGKKKLYIFKNVHNNIKHCMYFRKGFPFFEHFNKLLSYILYGGLLNKWISDIIYVPPNVVDDPQRVPLNIIQLGCAFLFLGIGYLISSLIFVTEIVVYRKLKLEYKT